MPQDRHVSVEGKPQGPSCLAEFDTMDKILARSDVRALLPADIASMFIGLAESEFRLDVSSTAIRRQTAT